MSQGNTPAVIGKCCVFCAAPLTKAAATNEHPIPQWLLRHFGVTKRMIRPAKWGDGTIVQRTPHSWLKLVVSDVCAHCNTGWLSRLENAVKSLLPNLASQTRELAMLSTGEELLVAQWAAKTAFLLQRTSGVPLPIAGEAYRELRDNPSALPARTSVFEIQDNGEHSVAINGLHTQNWTVHVPYECALETRESLRCACKISLRIDRFHLLIVYLPNPEFEPVGWLRVHRPLYPTQCSRWIDAGFKIAKVTPRQESIMVLFHVSLGLARNCSQEQLARQPPPNLEQVHEDFFANLQVPE
jgi:hypothetical protein